MKSKIDPAQMEHAMQREDKRRRERDAACQYLAVPHGMAVVVKHDLKSESGEAYTTLFYREPVFGMRLCPDGTTELLTRYQGMELCWVRDQAHIAVLMGAEGFNPEEYDPTRPFLDPVAADFDCRENDAIRLEPATPPAPQPLASRKGDTIVFGNVN